MARLKTAQFEERMTLVEHLDELRSRIIVSAIALTSAIVVCFIFQDWILETLNEPLPDNPRTGNKFVPITLNPTEAFFTTIKVSAYGGILLSLPILLYQAYAFLLPALSPAEKRVILPFLISIPFLFIGGVFFAYYVISPAALDFLLTYNDEFFQNEVQAKNYYSFLIITLMSVGILFQIPIGTLSVTKLGIVSPQQLAKNRKYIFLGIAVAAMLLPGQDPITMILAMVPLYVLFELSLLFARAFGKPIDREARWSFDDEDQDEDAARDEDPYDLDEVAAAEETTVIPEDGPGGGPAGSKR